MKLDKFDLNIQIEKSGNTKANSQDPDINCEHPTDLCTSLAFCISFGPACKPRQDGCGGPEL